MGGHDQSILTALVERVPAAVYAKDLAGRYVYANPGVEAQLGRSRAEIIGRTDRDLFPGPIADRYLANDQRALDEDRPVETTTTVELPTGTSAYRSVKFPLRDDRGQVIGIGGISLDVTNFEQTVAALAESETRFRQLAENIENAVFWITDLPHRRVLYVSPAYERLWGLSAARLYETENGWIENVHPEDRDRAARAFLAEAPTGEFDVEYRIVLPDGRLRWVRDRGYALPPNASGVTRVTGFAEDITDRKAREDRATRFQDLGAALSGAPDPDGVAMAILDHGLRALGANAGLVAVLRGELDRDGALVVLGQRGYSSELLTPGTPLPIDRPSVIVDAVRQRAPVAFRSQDERLALYPHLREQSPTAREGAGIALPLVVEGRPIGAIGLSYATARQFDTDDREALATIAGLASQALDRARLFAAADDARARYRSLFDGAADAILVADLDGRIQDLNPAVLRLLGYERQAMLELRVADLMAGDDATSDVEFQRFLRDGVWHGEHQVRRADGASVPVESNARIVETATGPVQWIALRDITERRALERLQQAFLSSVSHDLKNPLSVIKGQAQYLQRQLRRPSPPDIERLAKGLTTIEETVERTTDLIQELIDVARLRSGQELELHRQPVDLVRLARTAVEAYGRTSERHSLRVESNETTLTGMVDARRIERVIGNLLTNAIKFSPAGGRITIRLDREPDANGSWAVVAVRDPGVGIPAADLTQIFDRFHRGANVGSIAGSGIGLAGVRQIVEQHGGTIVVESRQGAGSVFTIRLPLASAGRVEPRPSTR